LRSVPRERWLEMLRLINCTILSSIHNDHCDAYLLSESSLFVYPTRVIIKTCGLITLLRCAEDLVKIGKEFCGAGVSSLIFSRRNFFFPEEQLQPHTSWDDECTYLRSHFPEGSAYTFGPRSCDHHYVFVVDYTKQNPYPDCIVPYTLESLEILMTGLDLSVMNQFWKQEYTALEVTERSGIKDLMSDVTLDAHLFDPLGYSMNALRDGYYYTIHVTPQPVCSFVSFETNAPQTSYKALVQDVIKVFKPESFTVMLFSETSSPIEALGTSYESFYLRNNKHHNFSQPHHYQITFSSFRQYGIISPAAPINKHRSKRAVVAAKTMVIATGKPHLTEQQLPTETVETQEVTVSLG